MAGIGTRDEGRTAFDKRAWADAYRLLRRADSESPLEPDDLGRLANAAYLIGKDDECVAYLDREHHERLRRDQPVQAVRSAFWLAQILIVRGDLARGGGWLARARRLLDEHGADCAERGYLLVPVALQSLMSGDAGTAYESFGQAVATAERFGEIDLMTFGRLGQGQSLIALGDITGGLALLDEAMVAVIADEVSPVIAGLVYCAVISACRDTFDLRRAQEWTAALSHWCESQPDLVAYRGQCLVHRVEIMQLHGAWQDAMDEVTRACRRLSDPPGQPAMGAALYQQAELHRLRGEVRPAEAAYQQANRWGHEPQPGLARLRLAQGQADAAAAGLRRALDESDGSPARARLLSAYVDVLLATGDTAAATTSATELAEIAARADNAVLRAMAAYASAQVLLPEHPQEALAAARRAWTIWHQHDARYEAARSRVLVGRACRELGDNDAANMEFDAAEQTFQRLSAVPDLAALSAVSGVTVPRVGNGLTAREVEVLRLVAAGKTNRSIATDLFLSEKTVARHVSNIFTKLDLTSRAAATAYAYQHDLV